MLEKQFSPFVEDQMLVYYKKVKSPSSNKMLKLPVYQKITDQKMTKLIPLSIKLKENMITLKSPHCLNVPLLRKFNKVELTPSDSEAVSKNLNSSKLHKRNDELVPIKRKHRQKQSMERLAQKYPVNNVKNTLNWEEVMQERINVLNEIHTNIIQ